MIMAYEMRRKQCGMGSRELPYFKVPTLFTEVDDNLIIHIIHSKAITKSKLNIRDYTNNT